MEGLWALPSYGESDIHLPEPAREDRDISYTMPPHHPALQLLYLFYLIPRT